MPLANALPVQRQSVGLAKETTRGVYVAPSIYLPVKTFKPVDTIDPLMIQYLGGSMGEDYGFLPGQGWGALSMTGDFFPDSWAWPLAALLGDVVTAGVGPYTHACALLNGTGTSQPTSHSLTDTYGATSAREYAALQWQAVTLTANADGILAASATALALLSVQGVPPTPALSTVEPLPSWAFSLTFNTQTIDFTSAAITLARRMTVIKGLTGTQQPFQIFAGPLAVTWKVTAITDPADTAIGDFLGNTQPVTTLSATQGAGSTETGLSIVSHKVAFSVGERMAKGDYFEVDLTGTAILNTNDAGASGGESPVMATITNGTVGTPYV